MAAAAQFEFMLRASGVAQKGIVAAQRAKEWALANKALVVGLIILLLALLLKWAGIM